MTPTREFFNTIIKLNVIGFVCVGLCWIHLAENTYKAGERKNNSYQNGRRDAHREAINLGLARYQGTNLIWNTNVLSSLDLTLKMINQTNEQTKQHQAINQIILDILFRGEGI